MAASQNLDDMHGALSEAEADVAGSSEMKAKIAAQAATIAAGLAGQEGSPAAAGSTGSGATFTIADTDDLTAIMMMVRSFFPAHFVVVISYTIFPIITPPAVPQAPREEPDQAAGGCRAAA